MCVQFRNFHNKLYFCPQRALLAWPVLGKAEAYPSEAPFSCPLEGSLLALPPNVELGWKNRDYLSLATLSSLV
jgi:hypothetical protein